MTHTKDEAKAATPHHDLIAELLNPNTPKTEREHAASREIERLQALATPVPLTDEQKVLRSLLGAALGALRYHTEQTRPIQRTNEIITAIEHELAAHCITKGQP
jgi:hypothetical protein